LFTGWWLCEEKSMHTALICVHSFSSLFHMTVSAALLPGMYSPGTGVSGPQDVEG